MERFESGEGNGHRKNFRKVMFLPRTLAESGRSGGESYLRGGQCQGDQLISLSMRDYVTNWKHGAPIARACVPYVLDL